MGVLRNRKVAFKLGMLFVPIVVVLIITIYQLSSLVMKVYEESKTTYYDTLYQNTKLLLSADKDFNKAQLAIETLAVYGKSAETDRRYDLISDYNSSCKLVERQMKAAMKNLELNEELYKVYKVSEESKTLVYLKLDFDKSYTSWQAAYDAQTGFGDFNEQNIIFDETRALLNEMINLLDSYAEVKSTSLRDSVLREIVVLTVIIIVITIALVAIAVYLIRYLRNNIAALTKNMNLLSDNDLTFEAHNIESRDELGILSKSMSKLIISLRNIVTQLSTSAEHLAQASDSMRVNSSEVTTSMHEIAKTIDDIADGASNQADEAQQLVQEIANLGDAVNKSTESTNELSEASSKIMAASQEGLKTVNQLEVITMNNQSAFESIFNIIDTTSNSAGKIGEASAMISDIAKKTKLLAFNASIEAASAGEAGRGFAVIAEEIRKLSELSRNSTMVIDQMLSELSDNIHKANIESKQVKDAVQLQTASVGDTKEKYLAIVASLDKINDEIISLDQISDAMEKSRLVVADFGSNVSAISQEYAASTEETSATTEEVLAAMTNINQIGIEVDDLVKELKGLIDQFRIVESAPMD